MSERRAPVLSYVAHQQDLVRRVDALWNRGILTGQIIERARRDDHVLTVEFEATGRYTLALSPRASMASAIPADSGDEVLEAMRTGQPPIERGETVAAWLIVSEWDEQGECVAEIHCPLRAWRTAHGSA